MLRNARARALTTGILALALAAVAQARLDRGVVGPASLGLMLAAVALFVFAERRARLDRSALRATPEDAPQGVPAATEWVMLGLVAALGLVVLPRFGGNRFELWGTLMWLAGLALLLVASWRPRRPGTASLAWRLGRAGLTLRWHHLALLGIVVVGAFYRLYRIGEIPLEMGCDLPHVYFNIRSILDGEFPIFFTSWPGREGLFFYLVAPLAWAFGLTHTTIKVTSALVGVATLPALYLLGKELFDREVGLYAAFLAAVSHWHIILTRVGLRFSTMPLMVALAWLFLLRGLRTGRRWPYALSGLFLGLGMYTYNAFMLVPAMLALMLLVEVLLGRGRSLRANLPNLAWMAAVALFAFIPLGRYAYEEPSGYLFRVATRVTGTEAPMPQDLLGTALDNMLRALGMFNVTGDLVKVNNIAGMRQLGYLPAVMFPLGLGYTLWRWRRGHNAALLVSLGTMLLPTALALAFPHEVPNAGRAIGALPTAILLAAVPLALVRRELSRSLAGLSWASLPGAGGWASRVADVARLAPVALVGAALAAEMVAAYPLYFGRYVENLPERNYSISLSMARVIDAFAGEGEAYIKTQGHWYDGNALRAQLRRASLPPSSEVWELVEDQPPLAGPPGRYMVIAHPGDGFAMDALRAASPRGVAIRHYDLDGQVAFVAFYGERKPDG